jgi:putative flippase GtrA
MRVLIGKLLRYFFTGGIAAIVDTGIFALLIRTHLAVMPAAAVSFCVAAIVNFLLTSRFVFKQQATPRRFMLFFFGAVIGLVVNVGVTTVGADFMALPAIVAKIYGIGTAFLLNFVINVRFVFRKSGRKDDGLT